MSSCDACLCPDPRKHFTRWFWIVPPRAKASLRSDINNMSSMQAGLQRLLNVTADSLAEYCGLTGDQQENSVFFERQVCILLAAIVVITVSHLCISLVCSKGIHPKTLSIRVFSGQAWGCPLSDRFLGWTMSFCLVFSVNFAPSISQPSWTPTMRKMWHSTYPWECSILLLTCKLSSTTCLTLLTT